MILPLFLFYMVNNEFAYLSAIFICIYLNPSMHVLIFLSPTYNSMTRLSYIILETTEISCMGYGLAISLVWGGASDCLSFYKNDDLFL